MEPGTLKAAIASRYPNSFILTEPRHLSSSTLRDGTELPTDYIAFMTEVGGGTIGDSIFTVYGGPIALDEIMTWDEEEYESVGRVILVGDGFDGFHVGYQSTASGWTLVTVDVSFPGEVEPAEGTLSAWLHDWLFVEE